MNQKNLPVDKIFIVKIPHGLHARPAAQIVRILQNNNATASLVYKENMIDASSMLEILELNIPYNAEIRFLLSAQNPKIIQQIEEVLQGTTYLGSPS